MNNKLVFNGGEPNMREDDFLRIQEANREFIMAMYSDYGNAIVSGATTNTPSAGESLTVTDGYVYIDNEMLKVDAGTIVAGDPTWTDFEYQKVTTYEAGGDKTYLDSNLRQTWQKNRAVPVSVASIAPGALDCVNGQKLFGSPWINVTDAELVNGWESEAQAYTFFQYRKLITGQVELRANLINLNSTTRDDLCYTLPVGFRPSKQIRVMLTFGVNELLIPIITSVATIATNGEITLGLMKDQNGSNEIVAYSDGVYASTFNAIYSTD